MMDSHRARSSACTAYCSHGSAIITAIWWLSITPLRKSACSLAVTTALGTYAAMVVHFRVSIAVLGARVTGRLAGFRQRTKDIGIRRGLPGQDLSGGGADGCAVLVHADAGSQSGNHVLAEARVGADGARLAALEARLHASNLSWSIGPEATRWLFILDGGAAGRQPPRTPVRSRPSRSVMDTPPATWMPRWCWPTQTSVPLELAEGKPGNDGRNPEDERARPGGVTARHGGALVERKGEHDRHGQAGAGGPVQRQHHAEHGTPRRQIGRRLGRQPAAVRQDVERSMAPTSASSIGRESLSTHHPLTAAATGPKQHRAAHHSAGLNFGHSC